MVTDTLLISRVANASIYVCRADYTHKAYYTLINELSEQKKLPNLCTLINGLDMKKKKYGYYYGYGKYGKYYGCLLYTSSNPCIALHDLSIPDSRKSHRFRRFLSL